MDKAVIVGLCLLLSGCAKMPIPVGIPCTAGPIIFDKADKLTRPTAEQIVALNESGEQLCNWKPPAR